MKIFPIVLTIIFLFIAAYRIYARILSPHLGLRDEENAPDSSGGDRIDRAPLDLPIHLAQHVSSISAAGPIIGPIVAGLSFGWLPALLWIVLGSIVIGAVHDFAVLVASLRHRSGSIAAVVKEQMGLKTYRFFSVLIWISLSLLIVVFTRMTAATFSDPTDGPTVATSSFYFLLLSLVLGWLVTQGPFPLWITTALALPLLPALLEVSRTHPLPFSEWIPFYPTLGWMPIILGYCFIASVLPLRVLLVPRGHLGGYFLLFTLGIGVFGLYFGDEQIAYPAFTGFRSAQNEPLFPILFVLIACGACSGFHALVCSGLSPKLLKKEGDARAVGYGGMLLEGLVAVIALTTLMIVSPQEALPGDPIKIYVDGLARFAHRFGVSIELATNFAFLAMATFVYDTLDVATRIGRGLFQEWTGWEGLSGRIGAATAALALPVLLLMIQSDANYLTFWRAFGVTNQLLAAFSLLGVCIWLMKTAQRPYWALIPMVWMFLIALSAGLFWMFS